MPEIFPNLTDGGIPIAVPFPCSVLFFDGTQFRMGRVDLAGRFQVRGEDQVFSFKDKLLLRVEDDISGADGYLGTTGPAAGEVWVVTNIAAADRISPTTAHNYAEVDGAVVGSFYSETAAFAAKDFSHWHGHLYLVEGDVARVYFVGGLVDDTCRIDLTGYIMTLET